MMRANKIKAGEYIVTTPTGVQWKCKKRDPELGGWAWQAWVVGSHFDERDKDIFADTLGELKLRIEGRYQEPFTLS